MEHCILLNLVSKEVNWFFNLNNSIDYNPSNLFLGNQINVNKFNIISSSNSEVHIFLTKKEDQ